MVEHDDYSEYIEYCTKHGIDPDNYDNYDDYIKDVLKKLPPNNYSGWDRDSKKDLVGELTQYFETRTTDKGIIGGGSEKPKGDIVEVDKDYSRKRSKQIRRSLNWQEKRKYGKVSATKKKQFKSIGRKLRAGEKLNKGENRARQRGIALRANELMSKQGLNRSDAWSRSNREMRLPKR